MSCSRITRQPAVLIKPAVPSKHEVVELSPFDNIAPVISFHFQFVYQNHNNDKNFLNPDAMKVSLAKLLVDFPLMAGRALIDDQRKWFISCNDTGVPFIVAKADMILDDFAIGDYDQLPKNLCTQWTNPDDPVWQVQITYFDCGGVILVSEMFHQLGDGETHAMLMRKWAKLHSNQAYVPPVLNRSFIRTSNNSPPTSFPLWQMIDKTPDYKEVAAKMLLSTAKLIEFSANEVQAMKLDAHNTNDTNTPWISSNDAVSAHMWRLITKARSLPVNTKTSMLHSCNVRKKIQPPLTADYVGNVLMYGHTDHLSANELVSCPLSYAAAFSRRAINFVTPASVQLFIDWISATIKVEPDMDVVFGRDVFSTSWISFELYSVAFENGEAPYFAGEIPTIMDGVFKLVEGRTKGSISVQVSLLRQHMDKLFADPELHKYATVDDNLHNN